MATLVVLNFFPAFHPASSGGELRIGALYRALSRTHDIVMLSSTDFGARFEQIAHTPTFTELRFPKDELWRIAYATLERAGVEGELSGLAFAVAVSNPECELRQQAQKLAATADWVMHEFPYSEPIFAEGCPCPEIYNSHNFEASLLSAIVRGPGFEDAFLKLIRLEGNLVARARRVFATSAADAEKFRLFYGAAANQLVVCPNGFDADELGKVAALRESRRPAAQQPAAQQPPRLLFVGSAHQPNVEAAEFLVKLADELPECDVLLGGAVCAALAHRPLPKNLQLLGKLDPATKLRLLAEADLFVNPVVLGSGTSLKAVEALGAGIPMVSTLEGVRGLGLEDGVDCAIVPRARFAATVRTLLADPERCALLAANGLVRARGRFSWDQIAQALAADLRRPAESPPMQQASAPPELILALNDYSVLEPGSGGVDRIRSLLSNIERDVAIVSFGPSSEIALIGPRILHVTVRKTAAHVGFESAVNAGQPMSVNDAVASLFAGSNRTMTQLVSGFAQRAAAVIFEHPYLAPLLDCLDPIAPGLPVIYSAHNCEATHKAEQLKGHRIADTLTAYIEELERRLVMRSDLVVCCTELEAQHFAALGARTVVVPNGCGVPDESELVAVRLAGAAGAHFKVGFLGSSHLPNVEAAQFIVRELAPAFPTVCFDLVGSVCSSLPTPVPGNVVLHGLVTEAEKTRIMGNWNLALNPVKSGGGSSLKLPDYMAHGLYTLSTPAGARGFDVEGRDAGHIVERHEFRGALARLIGMHASLDPQRRNARHYAANELGWGAIGSTYRNALAGVLTPSPDAAQPQTPQRRLLVVTYRYTEPALGGAEEYLIEILKRLRPRFARVDLACIDVREITNAHHFGCRVSVPAGGEAARLGSLFDRMRFFKPDLVPADEMLAISRNLERAWTQEEHELFSPFAADLAQPNALRLFGGFYWAENHGGVVRRWTSPRFSFLLPQRACVFQISGYAAAVKTLKIRLKDPAAAAASGADEDLKSLAIHEQTIPANFNLTIALPRATAGRSLLLSCEVDEHQAAGDHRPFGVLLESVSVLVETGDGTGDAPSGISPLEVKRADLSEEIEEELRTTHFERWVTSLRDTARRRSPEVERDFAAVRGPHSRALQAWVGAHAADYDCILVQGIPFDVIPSTMENLTRLPSRPRVVTLPHFHGDDRFYYWSRYVESLSSADATLLFSSSIASRLGEGDPFTVVPGGGVRADDHGDPTALQAFRAVHDTGRPFFLVLGRKTASKGYEEIIRAHRALRQAGTPVDLVMIGPDEDGRPVTADGVYYLGHQPRPVIRGALEACFGVVSMSRSESFGIVLCEAWLFGKPVIANHACYSFRELVRDGESGILVSSEAELCAAMVRLCSDPAERSRLGERGFIEVAERFTWERVAAACYAKLMPAESAAELAGAATADRAPPATDVAPPVATMESSSVWNNAFQSSA